MLTAEVREFLTREAGADVVFDEPMSRRTTLKIGGPADAMFTPTDVATLSRVLAGLAERGVPVTPVGGGSNLLVRDGGIRGVVLATRGLRQLERVGDTSVRVQAGVSTGKLLSKTIQWQLGGAEFLGGVPGSVGGGMIMNAGTYMGEFKDITRTVTSVVLATGERVTRDNEQCGFAYRTSVLPRSEVVVEALLDLTPRGADDIKADVRSLRDRRNEREPKGVSNSGSTFKNPEGDYAGRLIEAAGLKGTRVGAAECSSKHANWMVNTGGATAAELIELIGIVKDKVKEAHGIELQLEIKIIGEPS